MTSVKFAVEECKYLWKSVEEEKKKSGENELEGRALRDALRLDFTMTYYQQNCFLIDNFNDSEYICRMSRLELIN